MVKNAVPTRSWKSVQLHNIVYPLACIFVGVALLVSLFFAPKALIVLVFALTFSDTGGPAGPFFVAFYIVTVMAIGYYFMRKRSARMRIAVFIAMLAPAVATGLLLSHFSVPVYKEARAVWVLPKMEEYLENKYDEDFTVQNAAYCSSRTGFFEQNTYFCATAHANSQPERTFTVYEKGRSFKEFYPKLLKS